MTTDKWVCIEINTLFHHGDTDAVAKTIKKIFSDDLKEIRFVCNDILMQSGTYYCFVLCLNYQDHIPDLKDNSAYYSIVPSCEKPNWLTTSEVDKFVASVEESLTPSSFSPGDLVQIKNGYLKNLYGLVVRRAGSKWYKVSFRFHLRRFMESLPVDCMKAVDNVFRYKKFPVTRRILEGAKLVSDCKVHRQAHREHIKERRGG